jgi:hypothetical protein
VFYTYRQAETFIKIHGRKRFVNGIWQHCTYQLRDEATRKTDSSVISLQIRTRSLVLISWCCGVPCLHGPVAWPPRTPDLTPADFYLWDRHKSVVYVQRCNSREELWNAIEVAGTTAGSMPCVFQRTRNAWRNRVQLCIDYNDFDFLCKPLITSQMPFCS